MYELTSLFGGIKASIKKHNELLNRLLHWPSSIFDMTPAGRIVNRFGSDLDVLDNILVRRITFFLDEFGAVCKSYMYLHGIGGQFVLLFFFRIPVLLL